MATADQAHGGKDRFADHFGLFRQLRSAAAADWEAYVRHPFVRALADGSLPEECFRHYLIQDYLFLGHLARAYGLASFKAENLDDLRAAADALNAIINKEMHLHLDYCGGWGLTAADAATAAEAPATIAYTRFVLDRGVAGDLLDLWVALTPASSATPRSAPGSPPIPRRAASVTPIGPGSRPTPAPTIKPWHGYTANGWKA